MLERPSNAADAAIWETALRDADTARILTTALFHRVTSKCSLVPVQGGVAVGTDSVL